MSTTYFSWTFPVRAEDLPREVRSFDDVSALTSSEVASGRTLASMSRNDWLGGTIAATASRLGGAGLRFLHDPDRAPFADRSGHRWCIYPLDAAAIDAAILEGERLLERAANDAAGFADLIGQGDATAILATLRAATDRYDPVLGPEGEEEGDGPRYLFGYLKSLLSLLRYARERGLHVIHARHEH